MPIFFRPADFVENGNYRMSATPYFLAAFWLSSSYFFFSTCARRRSAARRSGFHLTAVIVLTAFGVTLDAISGDSKSRSARWSMMP